LPSRVSEVKEYLDIREINGYTIHHTPFHPSSPSGGPRIRTLVYIGTPDNDQFVGPQDPQALAEHISRSAGPSGPNPDYLFGLEAALAALGPESGDEHVTDLADRLRAIMAEGGGVVVGSQQQQQCHGFQRAGSVDEQEETEKTTTTL
jgi:glutathione-specific gamma-glutamylcyclotransferase